MKATSSVLVLLMMLSFGSSARGQLAPVRVLPAFPSTSDSLEITVHGDGCPGGPTFAPPSIEGVTIKLLGTPDSPCINRHAWVQKFQVGPLPQATYDIVVYLGTDLYAHRTVDVVAPNPTTNLLLELSPRFFASVNWSLSETAAQQPAFPIPLAQTSGYFWFFNSSNPEVVIKLLDGRALNNHFWVFITFETSLDVTIFVGDTGACINQAVPPCVPGKTYHKPPGSGAGIFDTEAFPANYPPP
ncbi:MAG TPA: hypothetical protein VHQ90_23225 [Thermoanaerobaculia bacterium]|nr:hypothetical protein [Thermoanaerobaculia bacterium]